MHENLIWDVSNEDGGLLMAYSSRLLGDCVKYQKSANKYQEKLNRVKL